MSIYRFLQLIFGLIIIGSIIFFVVRLTSTEQAMENDHLSVEGVPPAVETSATAVLGAEATSTSTPTATPVLSVIEGGSQDGGDEYLDGSSEPLPTQMIYEVVPGDTLASIARRNNMTVFNLKQSNALASDLIYQGQRLVIPAPGPISGGQPPAVPNFINDATRIANLGGTLTAVQAQQAAQATAVSATSDALLATITAVQPTLSALSATAEAENAGATTEVQMQEGSVDFPSFSDEEFLDTFFKWNEKMFVPLMAILGFMSTTFLEWRKNKNNNLEKSEADEEVEKQIQQVALRHKRIELEKAKAELQAMLLKNQRSSRKI